MLDVLHSLSLLALYSFLGLPGIGFFFCRYGRINIAVLFGTWMYCRGSTGHIAGFAVLSLRGMPY